MSCGVSCKKGEDMTSNKLLGLLQSRKFWASLISLLVAVGMLQFSDSQQAELVAALLTVTTAVSYVIGVALEDGLSRR